MTYHNLSKTDPDIWRSVQKEISRQRAGLEMIASENIVSMAVLEALGTPLTNKYSEGYPGKRYYSGNEFIDEIETLAIERAKKLFGADHANVQPHAGAQANMAAYFALIQPGDTVLAMNLAHGGHLTHGSPVNFSGKLYKIIPYGVSQDTMQIDYDAVRALAHEHKPKLIVAGATAYPRTLDFKTFREIADEVGALLLVDMAHIAGLVAAGAHPSPVPYADVVTTTTHKTLRGPRGAMILCKAAHAKAVDSAVFPMTQGGPLEHVIAAKAVALKEAATPEFKAYGKQVVANAKALAAELMRLGITVVSGGTDNHLVLADLSASGLTGKQAEDVLDSVGIYTNKNMVPFDARKPNDPSGVRLGTPALTTRGMKEAEMTEIASLIHRTITDWKDITAIETIRARVAELAAAFPIYPDLS